MRRVTMKGGPLDSWMSVYPDGRTYWRLVFLTRDGAAVTYERDKFSAGVIPDPVVYRHIEAA